MNAANSPIKERARLLQTSPGKGAARRLLMRGKQSQPRSPWGTWCGLGLASLVLAGCSALVGNNSVSSRNPLLASAKSVRESSCATLALPRELDKHVTEPYVVQPGDVLLLLAADLDSPVRM